MSREPHAATSDSTDDAISRWLERSSAAPAREVPVASRAQPLKASHAQQGMWLAEQIASADDRSQVARHTYRIRGPLDAAALRAALNTIVRRHEVLRTSFAFRDGELFQLVSAPSDDPLLEIVDVDGPEQLRAGMNHFFHLPFNLGSDVLLRARLFRLTADEHFLMLVIHHIASDGWSMDIVHGELEKLYAAAIAVGAAAPPDALADVAELAELPVQHTDFAHWQRAQAESGAYASDLAYWARTLEHAPSLLALPLDRPRENARTSSGAVVHFHVPASTMSTLKRIAARRNTTFFTVQLAAFQSLLALWSGQHDTVVGVTTANRTLPETEDLIGFFMNTLPIRSVIDPAEPFTAVLARTQATLLAAYDHAAVPFELILDAARVPRSAAYKPLIQVSVASHQDLTDPLKLAGLAVEHLAPDTLDAQQDLVLYFMSAADGTKGFLRYSAELFERSTIEQLADAYFAVLEQIGADDEIAVRSFAVPARAGRDEPARRTVSAQPAATTVSEAMGPLEKIIADVWREVIGIADVRRDGDFFGLGGTSLAALRVAGRLSKVLGRRVPVRAIFEHSRLFEQAAYFEKLVEDVLREGGSPSPA